MLGVVLAVVLGATSIYIYGVFLAYLLGRLLASPLYRWLRRLNRVPAEQGLSPIVMQIIAAVAGFGVGIAADIIWPPAGPMAYVLGVGLLLTILVIILSQGATIVGLARSGGGDIARVRRRLQRYNTRHSSPVDRDDALRSVRRIRRVGERLLLRAETTTLRGSLRHHRRQTILLALSWTANLLFSVLVLFVTIAGNFRTSTAGWALLGSIAGTVLIAPLALLLVRTEDRWWPRTVGQELRDEAIRVERNILRHAPAVAAPPGLGESIRRLWRRARRSAFKVSD